MLGTALPLFLILVVKYVIFHEDLIFKAKSIYSRKYSTYTLLKLYLRRHCTGRKEIELKIVFSILRIEQSPEEN